MAATQQDPSKAFLGVGLAFPIATAPDGRLAEAVYEEDVRQAILIILGTNPGERVMRPDFGAGLRRFIFEPVSETTLSQIERRVREALIDWEPRIDVEQVLVTSDPGERNKVLIETLYKVRATNTRANLVYPFYLEEGA